MYPSAKERERLAKRKVHRVGFALQLGSMAELHESLVKKGFSLAPTQFKAGAADPSMLGIMTYKDPHGLKRVMKRVEKGKPARWIPPIQRGTGLLVKVRTAATADVWAILKPKKRKKK